MLLAENLASISGKSIDSLCTFIDIYTETLIKQSKYNYKHISFTVDSCKYPSTGYPSTSNINTGAFDCGITVHFDKQLNILSSHLPITRPIILEARKNYTESKRRDLEWSFCGFAPACLELRSLAFEAW